MVCPFWQSKLTDRPYTTYLVPLLHTFCPSNARFCAENGICLVFVTGNNKKGCAASAAPPRLISVFCSVWCHMGASYPKKRQKYHKSQGDEWCHPSISKTNEHPPERRLHITYTVPSHQLWRPVAYHQHHRQSLSMEIAITTSHHANSNSPAALLLLSAIILHFKSILLSSPTLPGNSLAPISLRNHLS